MRITTTLLIPAGLIIGVSCSSSTGSAPKPAAAPAPAAAAAPAAGRGTAGAPAGAPTTGRGGAGAAAGAPAAAGSRGAAPPPPTLEQRTARADSITAARAVYVKQVMESIAGKENLPAGEVFKNIQLLKSVPAGQLVTVMDQGIGRGTGKGCNDCHITTDWASDTLARKKTARTMMGIVNDINMTLLPKIGPGRGGAPRTIQCLTCHRGGQAGRNVTIP